MYNEKKKKEFRKSTLTKVIVMSLSTLLPIVMIALFENLLHQEMYKALIVIRYIIFGFFELLVVFKIIKYILILTREDFCSKQYILNQDERLVFVKQRSLSIAFKTVIFTSGVLLIASCYFSEEAFYMILIIFVIAILTYLFSRLYYKKKY